MLKKGATVLQQNQTRDTILSTAHIYLRIKLLIDWLRKELRKQYRRYRKCLLTFLEEDAELDLIALVMPVGILRPDRSTTGGGCCCRRLRQELHSAVGKRKKILKVIVIIERHLEALERQAPGVKMKFGDGLDVWLKSVREIGTQNRESLEAKTELEWHDGFEDAMCHLKWDRDEEWEDVEEEERSGGEEDQEKQVVEVAEEKKMSEVETSQGGMKTM